jgi:hypothetical protein
MSDLKHDPIINAIQNGIKDDIEFNQKAERFRATLLLIYAAIDAMAFLNMPASQSDVTRKDFIDCDGEVFEISLQDTTHRQRSLRSTVRYYRFGKGAIPILRQGAKARGISFELTAETLEAWWHSVPDSCVYCGISIDEYKTLRDFILNYTGDNSMIKRFLRFYRSPKQAAINWMTIDRIDNEIGYEIANIVKCCWFCNSLKSDFFTPEEIQKFSPAIMEGLKQAISQTNESSQ